MRKGLFGIVLTLTILFALTPPGYCLESLQTRRALIFYESPQDLSDMERQLRFTPSTTLYQGYLETGKGHEIPCAPRLAAKIDGLWERICSLMGLEPQKKAPLLRIYLLKDGREVRKRYLGLHGIQGNPLFAYSPWEAFYEVYSHSIYISLRDLHEGILAHEMVHHILCSIPAVRSLPDFQEQWAKFVESRL